MRSLVLALLIAVMQVEAVPSSDNPCEGILSGILVDPDVCYQFFICYKEEAEVVTCPEGTIFSAEDITCIPGNQETCEEGYPVEPEDDNPCRGIVLARFPHPESCTKYKSCVLGQLREQSCRDGFVFSQRAFICLPGDAESCAVQILPTTTTPAPGEIRPIPGDFCLLNGRPFGRLPHPQLCTRFVHCQFWFPEERECPSWTVFNERLHVCLPGNPNTCTTVIDPEGPSTTTLAPITDEICEGKTVALVPHPYYCYMYVSCMVGKATERECPNFHVFSERHSMCLPGIRDTCTVFGQGQPE
ncbi:uncharacterized protein LOC135700064 [Ochlerotatus camptorhynchus]|uniref:uncharacterized protein LOC135700064 n=1 Tax=Ochlerotatus camptorhynchus TaxID=644619 RepID=UPI0031D38A48